VPRAEWEEAAHLCPGLDNEHRHNLRNSRRRDAEGRVAGRHVLETKRASVIQIELERAARHIGEGHVKKRAEYWL
jgi:hypothetical protein